MSAQYANVSNQIASLKELYTGDSYMKDLVYKNNPMLALLPKDESPQGFAGKYIPVPVVFGHPQGRSATFANAQANQTAPSDVSFFIYRVKNYQIVTIENELLEATAGNAAAFVDQAKFNMDKGFKNLSNDLAHDLFASGTGSRGVVGAITTSGSTNAVTITLSDAQSVVQFEKGMLLVSSATDGSAPSSDTVLITGVNRPGGIITGTSSTAHSSDLSATWAASGLLYVQGDIGASGASTTSNFLKMSGLDAWMPTSAVSGGDSFWGVNRSQDSRLQGLFLDARSMSIEEGLVLAASLCAREGADPDMCFINFASYASLENSLGSKVQYVSVKHDTADIAFAGIRIHGPKGPITIIPDRNCTSGKAYMLQMDSWKLRSLGKAPHVLTYGLEGLEGTRVGTADALEIRIGLYGNLICSAPCFNCVVQLSS